MQCHHTRTTPRIINKSTVVLGTTHVPTKRIASNNKSVNHNITAVMENDDDEEVNKRFIGTILRGC